MEVTIIFFLINYLFIILVEDFAAPATSSGLKGLIFWIFLVLILGCAFGVCYNVFVSNKKSLDAVPGLEKSIKTLLAVHIIRESVLNKVSIYMY